MSDAQFGKSPQDDFFAPHTIYPPPPPRVRGDGRPVREAVNGDVLAAVAERLGRLVSFKRLPAADLHTIGQLSSHLMVSLRTLRFYEQSGLLAPHREGTRRLYDRWDLERLRIIVVLRELETSLADIKELMAAIDTGEPIERIFPKIDGILGRQQQGNRERCGELARLNERIEAARIGLHPSA